MANQTTKKTPNVEIEGYIDMQTKFEAYTGKEPYLFVSYSHRDTAKVYPVLDALYDRKYRLWYDESCETGNDFRDELRERIEGSEAVLLFVSESSMSSPFCGMEIIVARENGKRLYPIYLDNAAVPPAFQILLANTHHGSIDNMDKLIKSMVRDLPAVYITFIGSMLIANDMALLTFLPLGYFVLTTTGKQKYMAFTFIMQNIAANLGGMLTPFGNPQNLYLYTKYEIPNLEFMGIMAPPFILSVSIITICCILFVKPEPLCLSDEKIVLDPKRTILYLMLFALSIVIVFRGIPYWIGLIVIPAVLLIVDRKALKMVDYGLLFTFVFFFIFAGNMARIDVVMDLFSALLEKSTLLFSVVSCQCISNVPSAILLSQFTNNYADLLVGVNIGGVGTLISSLASLITFREYVKHNPGKTGYYIGMFSLFNFAFLFILTGFMFLLKLF